MSENNEALVTELRTVTDDIAHDLRTPLTRIRGMAEVTAAGETSPDGFREMCGAVAEECDSMMQLINEMLEITRTESAIDRLERSEFSLSGLGPAGRRAVLRDRRGPECGPRRFRPGAGDCNPGG